MKKNGFTLVEVLIAGIITGITAVAISQMMTYFFQFKRYLEAGAEYNKFLNEVQTTLESKTKCSNSLGALADAGGTPPLTANGFQLDPATISNNPSKQSVNFRVGSNNYLTVGGATPFIYQDDTRGIRLKEVTMIRDETKPSMAVVGGTSYAMKLMVVGELDATRIKGPSLKPREYEMNVILDAQRRIRECTVSASGAACEEIGGVWDPNEADPTLRCGLYDLFDGCIQMAGYSKEGGSCTEVHPVTADCTCPSGYTAFEAMDFVGGGGKASVTIELFSCYKCKPGIVLP